MFYGCARVSTDGRSVEAQVGPLRAARAGKVSAKWRAAARPNARSFRDPVARDRNWPRACKSAPRPPGLSANRPHRSRNGTANIATIAWYVAGEGGQGGAAQGDGER